MVQLSTQDLSKVLELGRIALNCDSLIDLQQSSMHLLEKTLHADSSLFFAISREKSRWSFNRGLSRGVPEQGPKEWHQRYQNQDPFVEAFLNSNNTHSPVVVSTEVISHKKLIATKFYADFLKPQSIYHVLILGLVHDNQPIGLFGFHRPPSAPAFSQREAQMAYLLSPYLSAALEKTRSKVENQQYKDVISRMAYDLSDRGVIVIDQKNNPIYANAKAEALLQRPSGDSPSDKLAASESIPSQLGDFCKALIGHKSTRRHIADLSIESYDCNDGTRVVYLHSGAGTNIRQDRLTEFRLTSRQRAIAHLLSTGMTNPQLADKLCISIRTVQNHLRAIYAKVGVHNRTSLVNRLSH